MTAKPPYNPLEKRNLAESIAKALLKQTASPLPPPAFEGAGLYLLYYRGSFPAYKKIAEMNVKDWVWPIYVGKAIPPGARKGAKGLDVKPGRALCERLRKHSQKIESAQSTLKLSDFACRWLNVEDVFIRLGETLLISHYLPVWNIIVEGFGNNPEGEGRVSGRRPLWDILHPGRQEAGVLKATKTSDEIMGKIDAHFLAHPPSDVGFEPSV